MVVSDIRITFLNLSVTLIISFLYIVNITTAVRSVSATALKMMFGAVSAKAALYMADIPQRKSPSPAA